MNPGSTGSPALEPAAGAPEVKSAGYPTEAVYFRSADGLRLTADAFGSAEDPPVLLLPAAGLTREIWWETAVTLASVGRYVLCLDLRGHGESGYSPDARYDLDAFADDIRAVLGQLPSRPVVVGMAMSAIAAIAALGETETPLAAGLVLVGATLWVEPDEARAIQGRMARRSEGYDSYADLVAGIAQLYPNEPEPQALNLVRSVRRDGDGRFYWRWDPRFVGQVDLPQESARLEAAARRLNLPTLIVRGALNEAVSQATSARLGGLIAGSESVEIQGVGHLVAPERTEAVSEILLKFLERRAPRAPVALEEGSDPRMLRDALGCFATGVTIVTTIAADGRPIGLTANSFTSVSLDPPLILFCLSTASANLPVFADAERFTINVLHTGQRTASNQFARRDGERFEGHEWDRRGAGGPMLAGSLASFDCTTFGRHEAGDHMIFIGRVRRVRFEPRRDPLLFFRGKYRSLHFA